MRPAARSVMIRAVTMAVWRPVLVAAIGIQACSLSAPILKEELAARAGADRSE